MEVWSLGACEQISKVIDLLILQENISCLEEGSGYLNDTNLTFILQVIESEFYTICIYVFAASRRKWW